MFVATPSGDVGRGNALRGLLSTRNTRCVLGEEAGDEEHSAEYTTKAV